MAKALSGDAGPATGRGDLLHALAYALAPVAAFGASKALFIAATILSGTVSADSSGRFLAFAGDVLTQLLVTVILAVGIALMIVVVAWPLSLFMAVVALRSAFETRRTSEDD